MLTKKQKQELINELAEKLKQIKSVVFVNYKGLKVFQLKELRQKLKAEKSQLKVVKKTLIDLALKKAGLAGINVKELSGQIALALSERDEISAAKILDEFSKNNENLKILGAILEGRFLEQAEALTLARVPSYEQSLANLVRTLSIPFSGFISILQGSLRNLVFILSQIKN